MMLEIRNLEVLYGHVRALKRISVHVEEKEIVTLIGANGAGKSTLLNAVSGIVRCSSGEIVFAGEQIQKIPPHKIVSMGIAQVPEGRKIFPDMTVSENLLLGAHTVKQEKLIETRVQRAFTWFPILAERRAQPGGTLSGGEQQMLAIGRGLMSEPKLLLLDEPSLGLAPLITKEVAKIIRAIRREGVTILLVEQNARLALNLSDRGYVIETGSIVLSDTGQKLLENEQVKTAYLGG